jgi:hypothetical protein
MTCLKPIWLEKRETANRVRGRIETIIAKNVDVDDKDFRNPAGAAANDLRRIESITIATHLHRTESSPRQIVEGLLISHAV